MKLAEHPELNYSRDNDWIGESVYLYAVGQGQHLIFIQQNTQLIMTLKIPAIESLNCLLFPLWIFFVSRSFKLWSVLNSKAFLKQKRKSCDYIHSHRWASILHGMKARQTKPKTKNILWTIRLYCAVRLVCLACINDCDCDCDSFNKLVMFCVLFDHSYLLRW